MLIHRKQVDQLRRKSIHQLVFPLLVCMLLLIYSFILKFQLDSLSHSLTTKCNSHHLRRHLNDFVDDRRSCFGMIRPMDIILEKFKFNETEEVHSLWSDESATLFTNFPYLATLEQCRERLTKMANYYGQRTEHFGPFVIRSKDGKFLGLTGGDAGEVPGEYEIWYFIRREMWGQKIATSAVTLLLEMMKHSQRVHSIKAEAVVDNLPSWQFLEKLGFQKKNVISGGHQKNGKTWDRYLYVMSVTVA